MLGDAFCSAGMHFLSDLVSSNSAQPIFRYSYERSNGGLNLANALQDFAASKDHSGNLAAAKTAAMSVKKILKEENYSPCTHLDLHFCLFTPPAAFNLTSNLSNRTNKSYGRGAAAAFAAFAEESAPAAVELWPPEARNGERRTRRFRWIFGADGDRLGQESEDQRQR